MPTTVRIGPNEPRDVVVISSTELEVTYMGGAEGPVDVEVTTSAGSTVAAEAFYAVPPPRPPTITAVEPNSGRGGTRVTIRGTNFEE